MKMIKEKKYINEPAARVLIDPRDEDIVIVSSKGRTSIWIDGNEVKDVASVSFNHIFGEGKPRYLISKKE